MEFRKKGEMTSSQIVSVILVLVGFSILLLVYAQLRPTETIDREVCKLTVTERATLGAVFPGEATEVVPLKCTTRKVCLTSNLIAKGDCEKEFGEEYETYRISGGDISKQNGEVNKFLAQEMVDCWNMMGEGKLSVFSRDFKQGSKCSLCSRIAFDPELKSEMDGKINGLGEYLKTRKMPEREITYWDFLTWGRDLSRERILDDEYSMEEKVIIYLEVKKGFLTLGLVTGGGAVGGAIIGAQIGSIVPVVGTIGGGVVGFIGGSLIGGVSGNQVGSALEDSAIFNKVMKTELINDADGASANFFADYNVDHLSALCTQIESTA